jgi:uncharacterized protein (DUF2384 family)
MNTRRGVALLVTLMTMTVLFAGVAIIATVRSTDAVTSTHSLDEILVRDLLRSSESPILLWLNDQSGEVVLDPESVAPMVSILNDELMINEKATRLKITAWDQYGMIPLNADALGLDDALGLNIEEVPWRGSSHPGLDLVDEGALRRGVIPSPENPDAIGGLVATHNPWPSRSGATRSRSVASLNINTAPRSLVEAFFSAFNLGETESIFEKRLIDEQAVYTASSQDPQQDSMRIVSVSRLWSFRIDVMVGTIQHSWWSTYARQGGSWRLVQRIGISHE